MKLIDKIYYITNREDKLGFKTSTIDEMLNYCSTLEYCGFDIEATGLDPYRAKPLLLSVGDSNKTFVIDFTSVSMDFLYEMEHIPLLGQNLKYDLKVMKAKGYKFQKVYDTLIVENVLRMGVKGGNSLDAILSRRLDITSMFEKDTRKEFINAIGFVPERKHIIYSAEDTLYMEMLKKEQDKFLERLDLKEVCYSIEFPLLLILVDSEVEGIRFNVEKHKLNIHQMNQELLEVEKSMDKCIDSLLDEYEISRTGPWRRERKLQQVTQLGFLGVKDSVIKNKNKGKINYNSDVQIKDVFVMFDQPVPVVKDGWTVKESTGIEALEEYLITNRDSKLSPFIELLIKQRGVSKNLSSFGQNLINIINEHSGNLHTIYRQANADTGRFQSGDTKNGYINSQQIPALEKFRTCFGQYDSNEEEHKYAYMTMDLSGAELVILASNANDEVLTSLLDDPHSAIATASTQALINYIFNTFAKAGLKPNSYSNYSDIPPNVISSNSYLIGELLDILKTEERVEQVLCTGNFVVSKKTSKDIRNSYKAVAYGLAYGASASRISTVMNVPTVYAEIIEKAVRNLMPKTFTYLDASSNSGITQGYVIICELTRSRRWFKSVTDSMKLGYPLEKKEKGQVERACKNAPIQGTQAYMVKLATLYIMRYIKSNNLDANIIMWVHDEWVIRLAKNEDMDTHAEGIKRVALEACNLFLKNGLKMEADYSINDTWVK
jgi:DNA polymerase I-like protein with 3'-5' exonuclease and polymerase domains